MFEQEMKLTGVSQRNFLIGEEWLYFKIYTGPVSSDYILSTIVKPTVEKLIENSVIDKWFFIRYTVPHYHIRIRFHLVNQEVLTETIHHLLPFFKNLVENHYAWGIEIDTYKREMERYGAICISEVETLFYIDSIMILEFLSDSRLNPDEEARWLYSLRNIDWILCQFSYGLQERFELVDKLKMLFQVEFKMDKQLQLQLDSKFREKRKKINQIFRDESIEEFFFKYKSVISIPIKGIKQYNVEGQLGIELDELLSSLLHMNITRHFRTKNRLNEFVCYYLLSKYYKSEIARKKYARQKIE